MFVLAGHFLLVFRRYVGRVEEQNVDLALQARKEWVVERGQDGRECDLEQSKGSVE